MTHVWPASRNSFHPAWLLLLVPPAISWTVAWLSPGDTSTRLHLGRLTLMALVVLPWVWWRSTNAGPGLCRILKEVRLQLPGFLIAVGLPGVLGLWIHHDLEQWMFMAFAFGCSLMGATAFGTEFEQRTLGGLLSQPRPRIAIFLEKLSVLAMLLSVALAHLVLLRSGTPGFEPHIALNFALVGLCTGPLFSLWSRSTLAGLIFSVTVPLLLYLLGTLIGEWIFQRWNLWALTATRFDAWLVDVGLPLYLLASLGLSWRTFRGLELRDGEAGGKATSNLHPLSGPVDRLLSPLLGRSGTWGPLLRKEFRLQVIPWLVASLAVGVWLLWAAVGWMRGDEVDTRAIDQVSGATLVAGLMSLLLVLGTSAASIAEERELGTLEWQLTQPVPLRRQWWAKVMVTTLFTFALGLGLPYLLLRLWFGPSTLMEGWNHPGLRDVLIVLACTATLQALGMYASSLSRNTMKASALTVGLAAGLILILVLCGWFLALGLEAVARDSQEAMESSTSITAPSWSPSVAELHRLTEIGVGVGVTLLLFTLLAFGATNLRQARPASNRLLQQASVLTVGLIVYVLSAGVALTHLWRLQHEASMADIQGQRRQQLVIALSAAVQEGSATGALFEQFGVPTNAHVEELVQAILIQGGQRAAENIVLVLRSRQQGRSNLLINELAARYGLPLAPPPTNRPAPPGPRVPR